MDGFTSEPTEKTDQGKITDTDSNQFTSSSCDLLHVPDKKNAESTSLVPNPECTMTTVDTASELSLTSSSSPPTPNSSKECVTLSKSYVSVKDGNSPSDATVSSVISDIDTRGEPSKEKASDVGSVSYCNKGDKASINSSNTEDVVLGDRDNREGTASAEDSILEMTSVISSDTENLVSGISSNTEDLVTAINSNIERVSGISSNTENLLSGTSSNKEDLVTGVSSNTEDLVSGIRSNTEDLVSSISSITEDLVSSIRSNAEDLVSGISDNTENLVSSISDRTEQVSGIHSNTEDFASGICENKESTKPVKSNLTEKTTSINSCKTEDSVSGISDNTETLVSSISDSIEQVSGICSNTEDLASGICDSTENLLSSINDSTEQVSGIRSNTEDLASGICDNKESTKPVKSSLTEKTTSINSCNTEDLVSVDKMNIEYVTSANSVNTDVISVSSINIEDMTSIKSSNTENMVSSNFGNTGDETVVSGEENRNLAYIGSSNERDLIHSTDAEDSSDCNLAFHTSSRIQGMDTIHGCDSPSTENATQDTNIRNMPESNRPCELTGENIDSSPVIVTSNSMKIYGTESSVANKERFLEEGEIVEDKGICATEQRRDGKVFDTSSDNASGEDLLEGGIRLIDVRSLREEDSSGNDSREVPIERENHVTCAASLERESDKAALSPIIEQQCSMERKGVDAYVESPVVSSRSVEGSMDKLAKESSEMVEENQSVNEGTKDRIMQCTDLQEKEESKKDIDKQEEISQTSQTSDETKNNDEKRGDSINDKLLEAGNSDTSTVSKNKSVISQDVKDKMDVINEEQIEFNRNDSNLLTRFDDSIDDDEDDSDGRLMIDTETENEDNKKKISDDKHDEQTKSVEGTGKFDDNEVRPNTPQDEPSDLQMHVDTEEASAAILAVSRCEPNQISESLTMSESRNTKNHQTASSNSVIQSSQAVMIKEEPVDDGYNTSQRGDILDILGHHTPTTQTESNMSEKTRKRKRKGNAEKFTHLEQNETEKRIKQEPIEDYGQFNPFSSVNTRNQQAPLVIQSSPANLIATTDPISNVRSDSLSLLSKQVEQIPSVLNQPTQISQFPNSDSYVRFQLNTNSRANAGQWMPVGPVVSNALFRQPLPNQVHFARYTLQVTPTTGPNLSFSVPAPRIITTERPSVPQMTVIPPCSTGASKPLNKTPITQSQAVKEKFSVISRFLSPQGQPAVNTVTTTTSDLNMASVKNVKLHPLYATVQSTSSSNAAPLSNQSNVKKMQEDAMTTKTINIDSVGLTTITDLIARKNPMANYKPEPVPIELLVTGQHFQTYVCYECGDTFNLESSLKLHQNRYSLQISYKCDNCYSIKVFFNKCQFLSHLRGHLNIEKTQAVPIHIKSDSIVIQPLTSVYENMQFQPKTLSMKTMEEKCKKRCTECGTFFLKGVLFKHFNGGATDGRYQCNICKLSLMSVCSLRAHKRMHQLEPPFTCPECGLNFSDLSTGELKGTPIDRFFQHITNECMHLSRKNSYVCSKCPNELYVTISELKRHLFEKMDQYYKCNLCPMAFKMHDTFTKHFSDRHAPSGKMPDRYFKVLFRCHSCDSLIDDRYVLELHIQQHLSVAKRNFSYVFSCFYCRPTYKSKVSLKRHANVHRIAEIDKCPKCKLKFSGTAETFKHYLDVHSKIVENDKVIGFCSTCGFFHKVGYYQDQHVCLSQKTGKLNIPKGSPCHICGKVFVNILNHLLSHQKEGVMLCIYCQRKDFSNTRERVEHELQCRGIKATFNPSSRNSQQKVKSTSFAEIESSTLSLTPEIRPKPSASKKGAPVIMQPAVSIGTLVEYACDKCSKMFVTPESLESHKNKEHASQELFPCHLCGLTYESQQSMRRHLKMTHEGRRNVYPCLMCRKKGIKRQFSNRMVLEKHLMTKHKITKSKLTSNIVPEDPEEDDSILPPPPPVPSAVKHKPGPKATEKDVSPIKRLRVAGDQLFNCAKCSFSCEDRSKFLEHLKEHSISNSVQCLECGLCFAIVQSLRKHLFMVHKIKDFEKYCVDEGLEFKEEEVTLILPESPSDSENISHDEDVGEDGDPLECRVCYRKFEDQTKLRSHMRNHGMAFIRNRRRERTNSFKTSPNKSVNGNESSDSSVSTT